MTTLVLTSEKGPETFTAIPYFSISHLIKTTVWSSFSSNLLLPNCIHTSQFYKVTQNTKKKKKAYCKLDSGPIKSISLHH